MKKNRVTPENYEDHKVGIQREALSRDLGECGSGYFITLELIREMYPDLKNVPDTEIIYENMLFKFQANTVNALVKFHKRWPAWDSEHKGLTQRQWMTLTKTQQNQEVPPEG